MNKEDIKKHIKSLNQAKEFLENILEKYEKNLENLESEDIYSIKNFTKLRLLTKSKTWPEAVPEEFICGDDKEEKIFRANEILNEFEINETKDNFLDFGCGEGHVAFLQAKNTKKSVGYDITNQNWDNFDKIEHLIFSTNWEEIEKNGPYDTILCNDVLDHTKNPLEELKKIQKVKTPQTGKVIIRIHPWISRHGSHLYRQINKAYLHLIFSEDELFKMGIEPQEMNKILDPINFYEQIFKEAGFTILKKELITQNLEDFFIKENDLNKRIKKNWSKEISFGKIKELIEMQFIDFTLI